MPADHVKGVMHGHGASPLAVGPEMDAAAVYGSFGIQRNENGTNRRIRAIAVRPHKAGDADAKSTAYSPACA